MTLTTFNFNRLFIVFSLILTSQILFAQTAKKYNSAGDKAFKEQRYNEAINAYTSSLELAPNKKDIILKRATAYEKNKNWTLAATDYAALTHLAPTVYPNYLKAYTSFLKSEKIEEAMAVNQKLLKTNKKHKQGLLNQIELNILYKRFDEANEQVTKFLKGDKVNVEALHLKGVVTDSLKNAKSALEYHHKVIERTKAELKKKKGNLPQHQKYYVAAAAAQININAFDDALKSLEIALNCDKDDIELPFNKDIYYIRSMAYLGKLDFINSISDLDRAVSLDNNNTDYFMARALINSKSGQYLNAVNDYSKCIVIDEKNYIYYTLRGKAYTELGMLIESIADLGKSLELNPNQPEIRVLYDTQNKKEFEKHRENVPPVIRITKPIADRKNFINIIMGQMQVRIEGEIRDNSLIKSISFNGKEIDFDKYNKNPFFTTFVDVVNADEIIVKVVDVYDNESSQKFKIGRLVVTVQNAMDIKGLVYTGENLKQAMANTKLSISNQNGEKVAETTTNTEGYFKFAHLYSDDIYTISIENTAQIVGGKVAIFNENKEQVMVSDGDGKFFLFELLPYSGNNLSLMSIEDIELKVELKGKLIADNAKKEPITFQKVKLLDKSGAVVSTCVSDSTGYFTFKNLPMNAQYFIHIDTLESRFLSLKNIIVTDDKGNIVQSIVADKKMKFNFEYLPYQFTTLASISEFDPWENIADILKNKEKYEIVENIYYNIGAWQVTMAAELVLEKAVDMLLKNKELYIEVQSHTDSQASDGFNMELSKKRAEACENYLISKGVEASRIKAKGYGETQLLNRCKNDVECSDEEHKQNRRTVFVINYAK
jgi:outer membrane protein OmpA-like peptidoglycan-associated protein/Flp pilus assembly protein TadD